MKHNHLRKTIVSACCVSVLLVAAGCKPASGTSDDLKADYDRVVKERDDLKADFEHRKAEIESLWQSRVSDRDEKIAEITSQNAGLRQRLLVADAAGQDIPLSDSARSRAIMWLHIIYILVITICLRLLTLVMRVHVSLRERMRSYLLQQSKFVPTQEVSLAQ